MLFTARLPDEILRAIYDLMGYKRYIELISYEVHIWYKYAWYGHAMNELLGFARINYQIDIDKLAYVLKYLQEQYNLTKVESNPLTS